MTLLKVRGELQRALEVKAPLLNGDLCDLEWVTDRDIMERRGIMTAVAFDEHFRQFGTVAVVP